MFRLPLNEIVKKLKQVMDKQTLADRFLASEDTVCTTYLLTMKYLTMHPNKALKTFRLSPIRHLGPGKSYP
jgi:hypothetical protein